MVVRAAFAPQVRAGFEQQVGVPMSCRTDATDRVRVVVDALEKRLWMFSAGFSDFVECPKKKLKEIVW